MRQQFLDIYMSTNGGDFFELRWFESFSTLCKWRWKLITLSVVVIWYNWRTCDVINECPYQVFIRGVPVGAVVDENVVEGLIVFARKPVHTHLTNPRLEKQRRFPTSIKLPDSRHINSIFSFNTVFTRLFVGLRYVYYWR